MQIQLFSSLVLKELVPKASREFHIPEVTKFSWSVQSMNTRDHLTLKALITTAADDIHKYFFIVFQRK